tara:strand:- start:492 stop:1244 length:753 start_codon:yes stop_codon:yes gene_type:complete
MSVTQVDAGNGKSDGAKVSDAMGSLLAAAIDPSSAAHTQALETLQKLARTESTSSHQLGGLYRMPGFKRLDARSSVCKYSGRGEESLAKMMPILRRKGDECIQLMPCTDASHRLSLHDMWVEGLDSASRRDMRVITCKGEGTLWAMVLSYDYNDVTNRWKMHFSFLVAEFEASDDILIEHFSKSKSRFFSSRSSSWSVLSRIPADVTPDMIANVVKIVISCGVLVEHPPEALTVDGGGKLLLPPCAPRST